MESIWIDKREVGPWAKFTFLFCLFCWWSGSWSQWCSSCWRRSHRTSHITMVCCHSYKICPVVVRAMLQKRWQPGLATMLYQVQKQTRQDSVRQYYTLQDSTMPRNMCFVRQPVVNFSQFKRNGESLGSGYIKKIWNARLTVSILRLDPNIQKAKNNADFIEQHNTYAHLGGKPFFFFFQAVHWQVNDNKSKICEITLWARVWLPFYSFAENIKTASWF